MFCKTVIVLTLGLNWSGNLINLCSCHTGIIIITLTFIGSLDKVLRTNTKTIKLYFITYSSVSELWEELRPPLQPPNKFTARMLTQSPMEDTQTPPPVCASQNLNQAKLVRKEAPWRVGGVFFLQNNSVAVCIWVCETRLYPLMNFTSFLWWKQCRWTEHVNGNAQWLTS